MLSILNNINEPKDLKNLSIEELEKLASEIREILIRFLKFILNIPVPQLSNLILKEFLKELNNILE